MAHSGASIFGRQRSRLGIERWLPAKVQFELKFQLSSVLWSPSSCSVPGFLEFPPMLIQLKAKDLRRVSMKSQHWVHVLMRHLCKGQVLLWCQENCMWEAVVRGA